MCRRRPCFTAHVTPPWLACADAAQMAHTGRVTRLRARSDANFRSGSTPLPGIRTSFFFNNLHPLFDCLPRPSGCFGG